MPDLRLDGTKVCTSWLTQRSFRAAFCEFLLPIAPANKTEMLSRFRREGELGKYSGLRVSGISDLSFLKDFSDLLYLELVDQRRVNTRHLDCLANLRGLRIESPGAGIDFACFPHLEVFVGDWHEENTNISHCQELRQLRIWDYKPDTADLAPLTGTTRLEWLQVTQTSIATVAGVETLKDLRYLDVSHAPKLKSLKALANGELELRELNLSKAKNIESYKPLALLRRLRRLKLFFCAAMPDLKWTKGMDRLDFFAFVETNVESGDLSPLLDLPMLQYIGTMDKRHYNYKFAQLNELLARRPGVS